jgi:uncharacterized protein
MRIVLDTNVLVSALISEGKPRRLLDTIVSRKHTLVISRKIIQEFVSTSLDPRIQKYVTTQDTTEFLHYLASVSEVVALRSKIRRAKDEGDNEILATAHDGHAAFLVSGDYDLLDIGKFRGINIVTVNRMLSMLER